MTTVWHLFIYRLPTHPSRTRVAVWRELRRLGALPLQQSVVMVPEALELAAQLTPIEDRIEANEGTVYHYRLRDLAEDESRRLQTEWNRLRDHEYAEIVEECETKFQREIEFELFRGNLTGSEAEEIEADLEKIRSWFARVKARDCFAAEGRSTAEAAIETSQQQLDDFIEQVFEAEARQGGLSLETPARFASESTDRPESRAGDEEN